METERTIYKDFADNGLSWIDAVGRLERLGYDPSEAEELVEEWADALEHHDEFSE